MRFNRTVLGCAVVLAWVSCAAFGDQPFGLDQRTPWTSSHVHGSPEPPLPYRAMRAFPKLTFNKPLDIAFAEGVNRVFIAEQSGKLYSFVNDESVDHADLFANLPGEVKGTEKVPRSRGIGNVYAMAFHPHFQQKRYVYVCYVLNISGGRGGVPMTPKNQEGSRIARFTVTNTDPPRIDPDSEVVLLSWFGGGHNGCCLKFGPDGCLYISTGDGGDPDPPDPFDSGQDISDLLCSVLRIDVDHPSADKAYSIPKDNPFVNLPGARGEVFGYGLRNPWRMNFDRATGNLWVGDVGWELWESVFCVKPGTNCGWSIMEGPNPVHLQGKRGPTPLTPPAFSLPHSESASITGGVVYHGKKFPELANHYVFGDWQTSRVWAAKCLGEKLEPYKQIAQTDMRIVDFAEESDGELLILDHQGGGLFRLAPNPAAASPADFPRKLSATGIFSSVDQQTPAPGVIPFSVNVPQWLDGATAQRWVAVPGDGKVFWGKNVWNDDRVTWPTDTVLVRTVSLQSRRVETQILHFDGFQWQAYSYKWNDQQTDADLVDGSGEQRVIPVSQGSSEKRLWNFASRAQCMTCHNVWCNYTLAFQPAQLDREQDFGGVRDNQVRTFRHIGFLITTPPPQGKFDPRQLSSEKITLTDPYDTSAPIAERARSYMDVNCSVCHRFGGGGSALFDVRKELSSGKMNLIDAKPNLGAFGLDDARIVCPGDPNRSVLIYRMSKLGRGRMPHIGSDVVDVTGLTMLRQWIAGLAAEDKPKNGSEVTSLESAGNTVTVIDRLLKSTSGALALLSAIDSGRLSAETVKAITARGIASPDEQVRDLFRRFDPASSIPRLGNTINPTALLALRGDPNRGRDVFFGSPGASALCAKCHKVNGQGTDFGPDLSHVAAKFGRADVVDSILNPSKTIAEGFTTYLVRTKNGDLYSGLLVTKTPTEVVIKDPQLKVNHIPAADVDRLVVQPVSSMPEGLLADLTAEQAADLLAFLATLK
jgi:putative heme-binding domain-containing protein